MKVLKWFKLMFKKGVEECINEGSIIAGCNHLAIIESERNRFNYVVQIIDLTLIN